MGDAETPPAQELRALSSPGRDAAERDLLAMLSEQVAHFLAREVDSVAIEAAGKIPRAVREAAAARGLFGLTIPAEYGGLGLSLKGASHAVQRVAQADAAVGIMIGLHAGLGTRGLVTFGAPAQKDRWLPALARGECVASFAATEAGAGSDLGAIRTTARAHGDGMRLDGEKSYVTNGGFAGLFTVLAATPSLGGARAQSLLCVPRDAPGVEVGPEEDKLGIRASSTVTVRFEDVPVAMDQVLGAPGRGMTQAHDVLAWGRTLMAAGCVGIAESALRKSVEHVGLRRQFGRPIAEFGAVRAQVASMAARIFAMETLAREAGSCEDDASLEALSAMAKVFCSEGTFEVCDRAIQLHGALGFIESAGVSRLLRDCRITRIFEGANDVLLVRLGASALSGARLTREWTSPGACASLDARWLGAVADLRRTYGVRAVSHQLVLQRVARAAIALRAADAALRRAAEDGRAESAALAALAADELMEEGNRQLDGLRTVGEAEARAEAVASTVLGSPEGARRGGR